LVAATPHYASSIGEHHMEFNLNNRKQTTVFLVITFILISAHYVSVLFEHTFGNNIALFDLGKEGNIPTMFSTLLLLYSSLLLAFIWFVRRERNEQDKNYWFWLSVIFLFLATDEFSSIHETIGNALERVFDKDGMLWFPWKIPFGIGLIIFMIVYIKFLIQLPARTRNLFIISGFIFVMGAMNIELVEGFYKYIYKSPDFNYRVFEPLEELLEMIGSIIFIRANLDYIVNELGVSQICMKLKN